MADIGLVEQVLIHEQPQIHTVITVDNRHGHAYHPAKNICKYSRSIIHCWKLYYQMVDFVLLIIIVVCWL